MKKTLIILLSTVFLIIGCGTAPTPDAPEVTEPNEIVDPATAVAEPKLDTANESTGTSTVITAADQLADVNAFQAAQADLDVTKCQPIAAANTKQDCIDIVAYGLVQAGQSESCTAIKNSRLQKQCSDLVDAQKLQAKDQADLQTAVDATDAKKCQELKIESNRVSCLYSVASETKDATVCDNFEDQAFKRSCLAKAAN